MDAILFHNPTAGTGDHSAETLCEMLARAHLDVRYCSTKGPDFKKMLKAKADLAVIAGGDGTVRKVITKLAGSETPIAILPLGTANNIATSLGISAPAEKHAVAWRTGRRQRFDIGVATGPWGKRLFVEAVGCGMFAEAIGTRVDEEAPRQERLRLGRRSLRNILEKAVPLDVDVEIDGESVNGDLLAVEALNIGYTGSRLPFFLGADPGDRGFDVVCIRKDQRSDMLDWLAAPDDGRSPATAVFGRRLRIGYDKHTPLRIDDKLPDPPDKRSEVEIKVQDDCVDIIVPVEFEIEPEKSHALAEEAS
jgi:diacylglycerol kinase family enzyme